MATLTLSIYTDALTRTEDAPTLHLHDGRAGIYGRHACGITTEHRGETVAVLRVAIARGHPDCGFQKVRAPQALPAYDVLSPWGQPASDA